MARHYHLIETDFENAQNVTAGARIRTQRDAVNEARKRAQEIRSSGFRVVGDPKKGWSAKSIGSRGKYRPVLSIKEIPTGSSCAFCSGTSTSASSSSVENSSAPERPQPRSSVDASVIERAVKGASTSNATEQQQIANDDPAWRVAEIGIRNCRRLLAYGYPGTGKTTLGFRVGSALGKPVYSITCTPEMSAAEARGHYIPKGGDFVWQDGPCITAWREGALLIINEIDKAGGDLETFFYSLLDDPEIACTTLPTGENVSPAPGFQVLATMNGTPEDLIEALASRFPSKVEINTPHPGAIARLPERLRNAARGTVSNPNPAERIDMRQWLEYSRLCDEIGADDAAVLVFGARAKSVVQSLKIADAKN